MMPLPRPSGPLRVVLWSTAIAAVLGAAYSEMHVLQGGGQPLAIYGLARGAVVGAVIASILGSFNAVVQSGPLGAPLRRAPFTVHVAVKTGIYLIVILFGLKLGEWVFPAPGENGIESGDVLFALALAFVFVFILDVNSLLGQNVLLNFITGRYYAPRLESRVFLLIDMEGSTGLAERLGPLAFHRLVNRFVNDLTQPIVAAHGEIHRYIGDELIATWKLEEGIAAGRCVVACFAAIDQLAKRAPDYRREFGAGVAVRAGLHCGPVVTGEMGTVRKEIVFLGDTVNTAARIQELCRETGDRVLASADLIDRLDLPSGIAKRSLGDLRLRGKGADLALYALTRRSPRAGRAEAKGREIAPEETPSALP
jgi:adenylate cyclase